MMIHRILTFLGFTLLFATSCTQKPAVQRRNLPTSSPIKAPSAEAATGNEDANTTSPAKPGDSTPANINDPRLSCLNSVMQIVGGKTVEANDNKVLPSTVAIGDANGVFCTGTLVGLNQIITAAHCLYEGETNDTLMSQEKIKSLRIGMGPMGTPIEGVRVIAGTPHELFDFNLDSNDIGVLVFEGELPMNARPVRISEYNSTKAISSVLKAGYGQTSDTDQTVPILRQVEVSVMRFYPELKEFDLVNGQRIGTCNGDSGGPAFIPSEKIPGCFEVIGATSRGARDPNIIDCNSGNGIDADVRLYKDWAGCYFMKNGKPLPYFKAAELNCN